MNFRFPKHTHKYACIYNNKTLIYLLVYRVLCAPLNPFRICYTSVNRVLKKRNLPLPLVYELSDVIIAPKQFTYIYDGVAVVEIPTWQVTPTKLIECSSHRSPTFVPGCLSVQTTRVWRMVDKCVYVFVLKECVCRTIQSETKLHTNSKANSISTHK